LNVAIHRLQTGVPAARSLHRLDQILSRHGYCSRSEARAWVKSGRVRVRGEPANAADARVSVADVLVDGEPVEGPGGLLAVLHKPAGCVCSHDRREGPSVYDLLPPRWLRRNPPVTTVGRLDKDTTGVLLITDLGELVQRWTSPRRHVAKVYEVTVDCDLDARLVDVFSSGTLVLAGETKPCLPAKLEILGPREARLELVEGRYHQVKRMFAEEGCTVIRLHRSRFGEFELGDLKPGQWRLLPAGDHLPRPDSDHHAQAIL
jgi:16S rRNA pseudouridine516 synthase